MGGFPLELCYNTPMTNFPEFFDLLRAIVTKKQPKVQPNDENFDGYLAVRYLSFIHPEICKMLAVSANKRGFFPNAEDRLEVFGVLYSLLPQMKFPKIAYVSKPSTKKAKEKNVEDENLEILAYNMELGKREIRNLINSLDRTVV